MRHRELKDQKVHQAGPVRDTLAGLISDFGTSPREFRVALTRLNDKVYFQRADGSFKEIAGSSTSGAGDNWQPSVLSNSTGTPPISPTDGDRYLVPAGATGAWAGLDDRIVQWDATGSVWTSFIPSEGWIACVLDIFQYWAYSGSAWANAFSGGSGLTGTLTPGFFPLANSPTSVIDSLISQAGGLVQVGGNLKVTGITELNDYFVGNNSPIPSIVLASDSTAEGIGITYPLSHYLSPPPFDGVAMSLTDVSHSGQRFSNFYQNNEIAPLLSRAGGLNVLVVWAGIPDIINGVNGTDTFGLLRFFCEHYRAMGYKIVVGSLYSIGAPYSEADRLIYNELIRRQWPEFADAFFDVGSDVFMGPAGANTGAGTYYIDALHPSDVGMARCGNILQGVLYDLIVSCQTNPRAKVQLPTGKLNQASFSSMTMFGDSIAAGSNGGLTPCWLELEKALGVVGYSVNRGTGGWLAYSTNDTQIFPYENPTSTTDRFYSMIVGANDANTKGIGTYEPLFKNFLQAGASWLAIGSDYKVFGQDAGNTLGGTWTNDNTYQTGIGKKSNVIGSTLSIPVTSYGGPLYIWYRTIDGDGGAFNVQIDGGTAIAMTTATTPAAGGQSVGLLRIPNVPVGAHTVLVTVTSASAGGNNVSILGVGTVPGLVKYRGPKVYVNGVLKQWNPLDIPATLAYDQDSKEAIGQLTADGLCVYAVDGRAYVNNDASDMSDFIHPGNLGHIKLRDAFFASMQYTNQPVWKIPFRNDVPNPADASLYCNVNGLANVSTSSLNGGVIVYTEGPGSKNTFGMDFGWTFAGYAARLFSPQAVSLAYVNSSSCPASQSDIVDRFLLNCTTGQWLNYSDAPTSSAGYSKFNAKNLAANSGLNPGFTLFGDQYGADLGYMSGNYCLRFFTDDTRDISFCKVKAGVGVPAAQTDFTELVKMKAAGDMVLTLGGKIQHVTDGIDPDDVCTVGQAASIISGDFENFEF